jgi:hypothetical protein
VDFRNDWGFKMSEDKRVYRIFGKEWTVENCFGEELVCDYKTEFVLKHRFDSALAEKDKEIESLREKLKVAVECIKFYARYESVIKEVTQDDNKNIQVVHTFINHVAKETLKQLEQKESE